MKDMTDNMDRKAFLKTCMDIERMCADLYHFYSRLFENNPEAVRIWEKTAFEEENHEMQFGLALLLIDDVEFEMSESSMKKAYTIQNMLQKLISNFRKNRPDLLTALTKAVEMEEILSDLHVKSSLYFRDEHMRKLFRKLTESDRSHVDDLRLYLTVISSPKAGMNH